MFFECKNTFVRFGVLLAGVFNERSPSSTRITLCLPSHLSSRHIEKLIEPLRNKSHEQSSNFTGHSPGCACAGEGVRVERGQ